MSNGVSIGDHDPPTGALINTSGVVDVVAGGLLMVFSGPIHYVIGAVLIVFGIYQLYYVRTHKVAVRKDAG